MSAIVGGNAIVASKLFADAAPPQRFAGRILDAKGAPIANAEVLCEVVTADRRESLTVTRSGADGSFTISPAPGDAFGLFWIYSPGHGLQRHFSSDFVAPAADQSLKTVTLKKSSPYRLRLLGPDGVPRPGELIEPEVVTLSRLVFTVPPAVRELLGGVSDADGYWQANFLEDESRIAVRVVSESFGIQLQKQSWPLSRDVVLGLSPVGSIAGKIVTPEPARFAGKTLNLRSTALRPDPALIPGFNGVVYDFESGIATVEIDGEGRFRVPAILPGEVSVSLVNGDDLDWVIEPDKTCQVNRGETREVEIRAIQKVLFQGQIMMNDGTPAEGVRVTLSSGEKWPIVRATTDAAGDFKCRVCPGDVRLTAQLPTYGGIPVFQRDAILRSVTRGIGSDASSVTAKALRLPALTLVEGVVLDKDGKGVPTAAVNIWQYPAPAQTFMVDRDGRFRVYRAADAVFNQYGVIVNGQPRAMKEERGNPMVLRLQE